MEHRIAGTKRRWWHNCSRIYAKSCAKFALPIDWNSSVAQTFHKIWNWIAAAYELCPQNRFLRFLHRESISDSALITCLANEPGLLNQVNRGKCCECGKSVLSTDRYLESVFNFAERRSPFPGSTPYRKINSGDALTFSFCTLLFSRENPRIRPEFLPILRAERFLLSATLISFFVDWWAHLFSFSFLA